jgi:hypothetical protein
VCVCVGLRVAGGEKMEVQSRGAEVVPATWDVPVAQTLHRLHFRHSDEMTLLVGNRRSTFMGSSIIPRFGFT